MTDESVFAAALALSTPAERAAYLDRACAGNPALRAEVEALLGAHAGSNPLDRPPANLAFTGAYESARNADPAEAVGAVIGGRYKLLEALGEGGMGAVYMAEQTEPVKRRVAVKVIKPGMDTRQVLARFEAERQALAMMDHPNIAKVLDAGTTDAGRPFFVMELVKGVPITEVLRRPQALAARAAGTVRAGLPGDPARAPEGHHPPRHQAGATCWSRCTTAGRCRR